MCLDSGGSLKFILLRNQLLAFGLSCLRCLWNNRLRYTLSVFRCSIHPCGMDSVCLFISDTVRNSYQACRILTLWLCSVWVQFRLLLPLQLSCNYYSSTIINQTTVETADFAIKHNSARSALSAQIKLVRSSSHFSSMVPNQVLTPLQLLYFLPCTDAA